MRDRIAFACFPKEAFARTDTSPRGLMRSRSQLLDIGPDSWYDPNDRRLTDAWNAKEQGNNYLCIGALSSLLLFFIVGGVALYECLMKGLL